jgi:hypothetical protein
MTYVSIWDFFRHTPDQSVNRINRLIVVIMPLIGCHRLGKGAYWVVSWLQDGLLSFLIGEAKTNRLLALHVTPPATNHARALAMTWPSEIPLRALVPGTWRHFFC